MTVLILVLGFQNCVELLDSAAQDNRVVDFSALHILLTLDFIGDVAFGTNLHALSQGLECRILHLFEMILPEMMKCGLFPMRARFPVLRETRIMFRAIAELRGMAEKAVQDARKRHDTADQDLGKRAGNKIFEILAK